VTHDQTEAMSMADQVVLLNQGRVEQAGPPRDLYAQPATVFAARFFGTPTMNLVAIEAGRIAGSDVSVGLTAATLGIRPEAISLVPHANNPDSCGVPAKVESLEYLGADLVMRRVVGTQAMLVRTDGRHVACAGEQVALHWNPADSHGFDANGQRLL
jgi:sn-glycerol 3-phosphate transport system ATP-binding protein